jgi:hypothetical protein
VVHDRLRAKPPTTEPDRWRSGTVVAAGNRNGDVVVTVETGGERVEVTVTDAVFELVSGRVEATDPVGETVWFR